MNVNLGVEREEMLKTIYGVMPTPMLRYLLNLTYKKKACFLLSGLKCNFTQEWQTYTVQYYLSPIICIQFKNH